MKKHLYPVLAIMAIYIYMPAQSQFLKKLHKQPEQKSEEQVSEEADSADTKGFKKKVKSIWGGIFQENEDETGAADDTSSEEPGDVNTGFPMGSNAKVPVEDQYSFDTRVVYQFTTENPDSKEKVDMDIISWYKEGAEYSATRIQSATDQQSINVLTILDMKNKAMIMIMEDQKMAQVISTKGMDVDEADGQNDTANPEDKPTIRKTGRTKKILGYTCYEYEMKSKDTEGTFWIAPEAKVYSAGMFKGGMFGEDSPSVIIPENQQGMLMEMNAVVTGEDGKKSDIKLIVKSIDKKSMTINMADYQKMSFGMN